AFGSSSVKTPCLRSSALDCSVTRCDHFRAGMDRVSSAVSVFAPRHPALAGGGRTLLPRSGLMRAAAARRRDVSLAPAAAGTGQLASARFEIDCGPGPAFRLLGWHAALLIAFLDMFGLA